MAERYHNYVNGEWVETRSDEYHQNANPADIRELVSVHSRSGRADAFTAIDAAKAAFPGWRDTPAPARGELLARAAALIRERADDIARDFTAEEGKTFGEARGETLRAAQIFDFFAGEGRRVGGRTFPADGPSTFLYTLREPLGVVALVTPWNFPIAIPAWKLAPALVAGNAAVLKPATNTPLTAVRLFECLADAGLPAGVANMVFGPGHELGDVFCESEDVKAISFTGSSEVGKALAANAHRRLVKVQLELGGKNPLILADDGDVSRAVAFTAGGAFSSTGQKCTATSRAIVPRKLHDRFVAELVAAAGEIVVGDGLREGVGMGPLIDEDSLERVLAYIEVGKKEGATLACGGERLTGEGRENGFFVAPTVFTAVTPEMTIWREEIFGPVVAVTAYDDFDEAIALANDTAYGLSATLVTNDLARAMSYVGRIEAGIVHVNSPTVGAACHVPFGGYKESSSGSREQGREALEFFTQLKTVYLDT
ncbi:MAG: aldehyde dehydrogenase family protein [Candidatus Zixiibacteriota bacterium]|jgi:aldehyde dehydrogenase (NAD+)